MNREEEKPWVGEIKDSVEKKETKEKAVELFWRCLRGIFRVACLTSEGHVLPALTASHRGSNTHTKEL